MNEHFQKALEFSNYRQTLNIQRKSLKEKINAKLTYGYNGGIFKIDRQLISFCQVLIDKQRVVDVILLDQNENPILISNLEEFQDEIISRYFESVNEYFEEYEKIKKSRTVEKLLDL